MKISNLLFISMFQFRKNALGYLLACIEIFIVVLLLIYVLSTIRYYNIPIKTLEHVESSRLVNYGYNKIQKSDAEIKTAILAFENYAYNSSDISRIGRTGWIRTPILKESVKDKGLEQFPDKTGSDPEDPYFPGNSALVYDRLIAEKFPLTLEKGYQFTTYATDEGCIPVILHSQYMDRFNVGDTFRVRLQWADQWARDEYDACEAFLTVQVAGFLNKSNYHTEIGAGGSFFTADMLVTNAFNCDMILLRDENANFPVDGYDFMMSTFLIEVSKSSGAVERVINQLSPTGFCAPLGNVIDDSVYMLKQKTAEPIINLIILIIVAAAAIGGINGMNQISQKRDFGIYYICGATWGNCIKTDILRNVLIITMPAVLSGVLSYCLFRSTETNVLNLWDFIIAIGVIAAIYIISSLWYVINLQRMKPADSVKEWED